MIFVSLGANIPSKAGDPERTLRSALDRMPHYGLQVLATSSFYETEAWPNKHDPKYVNAVACVGSRLGPSDLLRSLLAIEREFGRVRKSRWEARCLDLDLLDFGGLTVDEAELQLPHPRMHERAFVLIPLHEIAPNWRHPDTGVRIDKLIKNVGEEGVSRLAASA